MTQLVIPLIGRLDYTSISIDISSAGFSYANPHKQVVFDFSKVGFVEPSGVVMLHNLSRYLHSQGTDVYYRNYNEPRAGLIFLDGTGFFEDAIRTKAFPFTSLKATTLRLREIRTIDAHGWVANEFLPWLSYCAQRPQAALGHFGSCISEIFNNIRDHSAYTVGSIFAQWYPNINSLKLSVGDFGKGIPATVATVEPHLAGAAAIERAFHPNFTSQSTPKNRGKGLDFMRRNVCLSLHGSIKVYSGGASVIAQRDGHICHLKPILGNSGYTGTLFDIELPTHQIAQFNPEEEEMEW